MKDYGIITVKDMDGNEVFPADLLYDEVGNIFLAVYSDDELFKFHKDVIRLGKLSIIRVYRKKYLLSELNLVDIKEFKDYLQLTEMKRAANLNEIEFN